jgi:uroporphyrinogen III methyltransferase/synthase
MSGKVYLIGAGPGDPGLLTVRAAELIASAEVVMTDALVSPPVVAKIPKTAEVIYVGKRAGAHTVPQDQTNRILVEKAREGKRVVRLKGGDPFVFGRGGEEAEELVAAGIEFEIVPGISSGVAGPAYAGIPVTHRDHATAVMFVTGHESDDSTGIDWQTLAKFNGTIVLFMGIANLGMISRNLRANGMRADQPVAVVSRGTTPRQRTVVGTLETIEEVARGIETPALIVIGTVVALREKISWFETKPLYGKRVVVTRARDQASDLSRLLRDSGAEVVEFPTIEIGPPPSFESLDRVIGALGGYRWIIFTSVNGVTSFFDRLKDARKDARSLAGRMIAAVGDTTAEALRDRGIEPDLIPPKFQSTALLPLLEQDQRGIRTAVIRAAVGSDELIDELRKRGGEVDLAVAYETKPVAGDVSRLENIDIVTFTSGSTVDNFFSAIENGIAKHARLASIGPMTSEAIRRHGRTPDIESDAATVAALHAAILRACRSSATS